MAVGNYSDRPERGLLGATRVARCIADWVAAKSGGMPTAVRVGMGDQVISVRTTHSLSILKYARVPWASGTEERGGACPCGSRKSARANKFAHGTLARETMGGPSLQRWGIRIRLRNSPSPRLKPWGTRPLESQVTKRGCPIPDGCLSGTDLYSPAHGSAAFRPPPSHGDPPNRKIRAPSACRVFRDRRQPARSRSGLGCVAGEFGAVAREKLNRVFFPPRTELGFKES